MFPPELAKKFTLLEHFRKYLDNDQIIEDREVVYLKKWLLTEHAIILRLSNKVVQIRFMDKTELLLSNFTKTVTFIDKTGKSEVHSLKNALESKNKELTKRLNYTTEMINRMIPK